MNTYLKLLVFGGVALIGTLVINKSSILVGIDCLEWVFIYCFMFAITAVVYICLGGK